ncbi:unnamed protein product [Linum tenue]|uniref:Uncharacterized protein n=1 Tax=Linum tenue TaxID=586396 RepID=A0AAV0S2K3_9ROSI|nr:unnamed protein product [Linum tenue]
MKNREQQKTVKTAMVFLGFCLVAYIVIPPLFWHLSDFITATSSSSSSSSSSYCPPCFCDCSTQPLFSLFDDLSANTSFSECTKKQDPEVGEEAQSNFTELLAEEVKLKEAEAVRNQQRADVALLEAKKMTSQYQKEADKCSAGMDTCEVARETAEEALASQRQISALWERRARQRGWRPAATTVTHHLHSHFTH